MNNECGKALKNPDKENPFPPPVDMFNFSPELSSREIKPKKK
jgi:hypothetical protein